MTIAFAQSQEKSGEAEASAFGRGLRGLCACIAYRAVRAGAPAVAAADALRAVGRAVDRDIQLACLLACAAFGACILIDAETVQRDRVEQPIDCAERAQVAAERPVDDNAQHHQNNQDRRLPGEQPAKRRAQRRVCGDQRNACEQRAGRADILAEPGLALADNIQHGQRQDDDETEQDHIFQVFQPALAGQAAQLFDKGDLVQQILHQPERAQPAANQAAEQRPEQQQEADDIKAELVLAAGDDGLQGADRAGAERTRAGIAVQAGDAYELACAFIDVALRKTGGVTVCQGGKSELHEHPHMIFQFTQGRCTPYRY